MVKAILAAVLLLSTSASAGILSATNSTPGSVDAIFPGEPPNGDFCANVPIDCFINRIVTLGSGIVQHVNLTVTLAWIFGEGSAYLAHNGVQMHALEHGHSSIPGSGFHTLTFDDFAAAALPNPVISGLYRPDQALSAFNGMDAAGDWIVTIGDWDTSDPTRFQSFTLNVTTAVPEPGTLALFALALFGLAGARLRNRVV